MKGKDQDQEALSQDHNMITIIKDQDQKSLERPIDILHLHGKTDQDPHLRRALDHALEQEDLDPEIEKEDQNQDQLAKLIQDPDQEEGIPDQNLLPNIETDLGLTQEEEGIENQLMIGVYLISKFHQFPQDMYPHLHHPPHQDMILIARTGHRRGSIITLIIKVHFLV